MFERTLERARSARDARGTDGGFTLVELLIVITILGVLAAIVVFSVQGITNNSSTVACKATKNTVQTAVEAYYAQNPATGYPASLTAVYNAGLLKSDPTGTNGLSYNPTTGVVTSSITGC